jgi:hypothetical protein
MMEDFHEIAPEPKNQTREVSNPFASNRVTLLTELYSFFFDIAFAVVFSVPAKGGSFTHRSASMIVDFGNASKSEKSEMKSILGWNKPL